MGSQKCVPSLARTVSWVISKSNAISPSRMTLASRTRPADKAFSQAGATSATDFRRDWPLPEEDITGLTKLGKPIFSAAACNSASDDAKA